MRKILALALAIMMVFSMTIMASAESTTILTTTVPPATYTLNVPANQEIVYGSTETDIGSISVTDGVGFAEGKNLKITLTYGAFTSNDVNTTIPYSIRLQNSTYGAPAYSSDAYLDIASGKSLTFKGKADGTVAEYSAITYTSNGLGYDRTLDDTMVRVNSSSWRKALAGEYSSTITFTAEIVVE